MQLYVNEQLCAKLSRIITHLKNKTLGILEPEVVKRWLIMKTVPMDPTLKKYIQFTSEVLIPLTTLQSASHFWGVILKSNLILCSFVTLLSFAPIPAPRFCM